LVRINKLIFLVDVIIKKEKSGGLNAMSGIRLFSYWMSSMIFMTSSVIFLVDVIIKKKSPIG